MIEWILKKINVARQEPQVLVVGIEGSGRRTVEHRLNPPGSGGITKSILTDPVWYEDNIINQDVDRLSLSVYGGNASATWYGGDSRAAGVICVVDSSDEAKIEATKIALARFCERYEKELKKAVFLVLANKQDRSDALSVAEVKETLELETQFKGRRWHIQGTQALSDLGITEGVEWMTRQILRK